MANGDISLSSPKTISVPTLQLASVLLDLVGNSVQLVYLEAGTGVVHVVVVTDTGAVGVDYSGGVFTDSVKRVISGEFTKLLGLLFKAGARTTLTQTLITDGVLTVAGTVG